MFSLMPWKNQRKETNALATRTEHPLNLFGNRFDQILDSFFGHWPTLFNDTWPAWNDLAAQDKGSEFVVRVDAPGFEAGDFDIRISGNMLQIHAERLEESNDDGPRTQRYLARSVSLPAGVDPQKVEANYRNGVLDVTLPKTEEAKPKKITVKTA